MCDRCVIDSVKARMLKERPMTRRDWLKASAVGFGGAVASSAPVRSEIGGAFSTVEDLSHELHPDFPTYFGVSGFSTQAMHTFERNRSNLLLLSLNEHTGTHIDAPLHFSADGLAVNEIPVSNLVVPLCVIDIAARAESDPDTQVTPDDIARYVGRYGPIPDNACVAMHSGWAKHVNTDRYRNTDWLGSMHFPGFHEEAAALLIEESTAVGLAVDTLSLDRGRSRLLPTHYAWLPTNRYGIENLANLDRVPAAGATLVVGAPKHRGGTGGPARIFALV